MIDPNEINQYVTAFNNIFEILRSFKRLIENSIRKQRPGHRTIKLDLTADIKDAISSGDLVYGDKIKVEGYLSKYAHIVLPASFMNSVYDSRRAQKIQEQEPNVILVGAWKAAQIPISSLQPVLTEEGKLFCGFLYSKHFGGFLYNQAVDPKDDLRGFQISMPPKYTPRVKIPEYSRPIPVIFYEDKYSSLLDHYVELEARVQPIPREFMPDLRKIYDTHFDKDFLSLFVDLGTERLVKYCLSVCDPDTEIKPKGKKSLTNRLVLYAEGHIEVNRFEKELIDIVRESVPLDRAPWVLSTGGREERVMFVPDDELFAFYKPPFAIGFYAQTSEKFPFYTQHRRLAKYYNLFRENLEERVKLLDSDLKPSFKLDFLYDFSRAWDFDSAGVLNSKIAYEILKGDPSLQETKKWLRGDK